jgi:hypothetical protein
LVLLMMVLGDYVAGGEVEGKSGDRGGKLGAFVRGLS